MALPPLIRLRAESIVAAYCAERVPFRVREKVRVTYGVRGNAVTIYEERPGWNDASAHWTSQPVAQLRYRLDSADWALYWMRASGRWWLYGNFKPSASIQDLLKEIDADPSGAFWG